MEEEAKADLEETAIDDPSIKLIPQYVELLCRELVHTAQIVRDCGLRIAGWRARMRPCGCACGRIGPLVLRPGSRGKSIPIIRRPSLRILPPAKRWRKGKNADCICGRTRN